MNFDEDPYESMTRSAQMTDEITHLRQLLEAANAKLAEREKQEPYLYVHQVICEGISPYIEIAYTRDGKLDSIEQVFGKGFVKEVTPPLKLYTAPVPALAPGETEIIEILEKVTEKKLEWLNSDDGGHIMELTDKAEALLEKVAKRTEEKGG